MAVSPLRRSWASIPLRSRVTGVDADTVRRWLADLPPPVGYGVGAPPHLPVVRPDDPLRDASRGAALSLLPRVLSLVSARSPRRKRRGRNRVCPLCPDFLSGSQPRCRLEQRAARLPGGRPPALEAGGLTRLPSQFLAAG